MTERTARGLLALVVLAYIAVFLRFPPLDVQDYPNHLARALVMEDLIFRHGAEFGQSYQFHFLFTPYVLGDLLLAGLIQLAGFKAAASIWVILTFLSLPASLFMYLRARQTSAEVTVLMLFISLYLSTDTFFVLGFLEFRLSIALVLVALALVELLRRRWSVANYVIFAAVVVTAYLTHLAAIAFIATAAGVSAVWRIILGKSRIDREALLMIPVIGVLAWHFMVAVHYRQSQDIVAETDNWGTVAGKVTGLAWHFVRYNRLQDSLLIAMLVTFLLLCLREKRIWGKDAFVKPEVLEPWGYATVFFGLYVALPVEQVEASYIDVRALTFVPLFFVLGLLNLPPRTPGVVSRTSTVLVCVAAAVAVANLVYLAHHFRKDSLWLAQYRAVVANIPEHAVVLPVYSGHRIRSIYPGLNVASFAVIDRHALIPYLFSGDRGSPMKYFRYARRLYTPDGLWYQSRLDRDIDWKEVPQNYRYLLMMKPFEAGRILIKTHTIAENDAAALLAID
jgi:hypothetical protein